MVLATLVSLLNGFLLVSLVMPGGPWGAWGWALRLSLAPALGLGVSFVISFLAMLIAGPREEAIIISDLVVLVALGAAFALRLMRDA